MDKETIIIKTIEKHFIDSLDCELDNGMDLKKTLQTMAPTAWI